MSKTQQRLLILVVVLTAAYVVGIALNLSPYLRGPGEWRWAYVIPGTLSRLWLSGALLVVYVLLLYYWDGYRAKNQRKHFWLLLAALMTPLLQLSLLYLDHVDVRSQLFYRTVSELSGGFYNVGAVVTDIDSFLANFVHEMPNYPVHPQRHPPGLPLIFAFARQFFDQFPQLAEYVSDILRSYQCHNLVLMNQPNSAIAAAGVQMLVPFGLALVVWPVYYFGRLVYDESTAMRAALLWPLIPSVALWATRWNHLYALVAVMAYLFFHLGLSRHRGFFLLSGLVVSIGTLMSLGNFAIVGLLALYALVWLLVQKDRPTFSWLFGGALLFILGLSATWIVLGFTSDLKFFALWDEAMGTHLRLGRRYIVWLFYHPYDFFVFLGIPLFVYWVVQTFSAFSGWLSRRYDILGVSFALGLFALIVSGTSQGEVARVWAFLLPMALLIAARGVPQDGSGIAFLVVTGSLAVQVLISNIFLSPVSTGLTDPPSPPAVADQTGEPYAVWVDGLMLQDFEVPEAISAGSTLEVQAVWNSYEQPDQPYTFFLHLLDEGGNLVAQIDTMPVDAQWMTTCWRPDQPFRDSYRIQIPSVLEPAEYRLLAGFYQLPGGERLQVQIPKGRVNNNIDLGVVSVEAQETQGEELLNQVDLHGR